METREYQLRIPTNDYGNRMEAIELLTKYLREITGEKLNPNKADTTIYLEAQLTTRNCGHTFSEVRVRQNFDENGEIISGNSATLDINNDSVPPTYKADALTWNLTAAEGYNSEQKIEQDIHRDHYKYNRKAKIKDLPQSFQLKNCGQLTEMFPSAFKEPVKDPTAHVLQTGQRMYIW
eukprot:CAMPEP_0117017370 /NCGR_PEP_ID=MMETSP0472-20121206/13570_1 /TAXON_ID=693140 ORGANISM="Tiarina fusus, Strain LIS" /NCGR_SAMPLE_ID=MMETSP0472 /ASSEMBLY_ACC=CAM_ASM_000603 /LENGTH=177 /DNA_ID=CAMNT_0004721711 /DNA_START=282 /DNA_END=812 /DNA_ORIENTATION=+